MSGDSHSGAHKGAAGGGHGHKKGGHHDEEHEEHVNHEAWVIPYADMLTLLMAMFLVMWATSNSDTAKFQAIAAALANEFGGKVPITGGEGVLSATGATSGGSPVDFGLNAGRSVRAELALQAQEAREQALIQEKQALKSIQEQLQAELDAAGLGDKVSFSLEERGLVVSILSDQVLFQSGEADIQPDGLGVLDDIAEPVKKLGKPLVIEGHTDSRPISTGKYPSNWELSTQRATNVLRYLIGRWGFDPTMVQAAGYGDTRPVADNNTTAGQAKNRRVEIVILSTIK